jgi:hypothetical protein
MEMSLMLILGTSDMKWPTGVTVSYALVLTPTISPTWKPLCCGTSVGGLGLSGDGGFEAAKAATKNKTRKYIVRFMIIFTTAVKIVVSIAEFKGYCETCQCSEMMGGRLEETSSKIMKVHKVPLYWRAVYMYTANMSWCWFEVFGRHF